VFNGTIAEVASAVATFTALREANVYPTGIQLYVYIGGVLVWAVIDDSQTPNWQNINNAQSGVWVAVSNSQTPNWQNINNPQTPGWSDVVDTQAPGWTILPS
jgi:hypothetical protein